MKITTVGIDLAKSVFTVHGVDEHGKPALRKTVRRGKLLELYAQLPACVVGMEACSGAQHWARELRKLGHEPRIMAAEFVEPYRRGGKNDTNDAAAICEAVSRPQMRFVPIKSVEQQAVLAVHRLRQGLVEERTALANRLRGLLAEYGLIVALDWIGYGDRWRRFWKMVRTGYRESRVKSSPMQHNSYPNSMFTSVTTIDASQHWHGRANRCSG
jgi:transposase